MEVYLNVIEMGPCKYGVGAAAKDYFGVSASNLSREQAALIAACLPNPKKYSVSKPGPYMKKRQTQIARLMRLIGDDYFNRYSKDVAEEKREAEEREVEEKLKAVPEDDIPTVIEEEQEVQELPTEESTNDPVMEEEAAPVETASPDSTSSL
jgi:membrane peptidoglycan carboxypeptidase